MVIGWLMAGGPFKGVTLSGGRLGELYPWDALTGKKLASPSADWIYDLAYRPGWEYRGRLRLRGA
jgi:hypothetical protein